MSAFFAFDIGYEVSLDKLNTLTSAVPVQPLSPKKRTPSSIQYARPPRVMNLGTHEIAPSYSSQIQATTFDFGVISIVFKFPLPTHTPEDVVELPAIAQQIYNANLTVEARRQAEAFMKSIEPAIAQPRFSPLVEDYYVFVLERLSEPMRGDELLSRYRSVLTQTLRFETATLSAEQQEDALRQRLSYYERDLLLIDWNAAIIYDQDYEDTLRVLELLNVELLEARYIDSELDKRVEDCARLAHGGPGFRVPFRGVFVKDTQELAELRIESTLLAERIGNSLKLIGDLYLARAYSAGAERFYLRQWERAISHKLDVIEDFYEVVTDRVRTAQGHGLEIVVIALILVELLLALFRH